MITRKRTLKHFFISAWRFHYKAIGAHSDVKGSDNRVRHSLFPPQSIQRSRDHPLTGRCSQFSEIILCFLPTAAMDGTHLGTGESTQAGAVGERHPEPKPTRREEGPEPFGGNFSGSSTSVVFEDEEPIKVRKQIQVDFKKSPSPRRKPAGGTPRE